MTIHDEEIRQIDHAAVALDQALEEHGEALDPYLDDHLKVLRRELVRLRRALLGLEMGVLYHDYGAPPELLDELAAHKELPIEEAAAMAHDRRHPED